MSAYFVHHATIDAVVTAVLALDGSLRIEAATDLGRALRALNAEAVRWRYGLDTGPPEKRAEHDANLADVAGYAWTPMHLPLAVMVKAVDCLHYQCGEGPGRDTALHGRLTALARRLHASGIRATAGYARAPWGLEAADIRPGRFVGHAPCGKPGGPRDGARSRQQPDLFG